MHLARGKFVGDEGMTYLFVFVADASHICIYARIYADMLACMQICSHVCIYANIHVDMQWRSPSLPKCSCGCSGVPPRFQNVAVASIAWSFAFKM